MLLQIITVTLLSFGWRRYWLLRMYLNWSSRPIREAVRFCNTNIVCSSILGAVVQWLRHRVFNSRNVVQFHAASLQIVVDKSYFALHARKRPCAARTLLLSFVASAFILDIVVDENFFAPHLWGPHP